MLERVLQRDFGQLSRFHRFHDGPLDGAELFRQDGEERLVELQFPRLAAIENLQLFKLLQGMAIDGILVELLSQFLGGAARLEPERSSRTILAPADFWQAVRLARRWC